MSLFADVKLGDRVWVELGVDGIYLDGSFSTDLALRFDSEGLEVMDQYDKDNGTTPLRAVKAPLTPQETPHE